MPMKIKAFAESALVDPITVNVGRAGAANLDVIQEVEYVKEEAKIIYLLECLQKTAPPVRWFSPFFFFPSVSLKQIAGNKCANKSLKKIWGAKHMRRDKLAEVTSNNWYLLLFI